MEIGECREFPYDYISKSSNLNGITIYLNLFAGECGYRVGMYSMYMDEHNYSHWTQTVQYIPDSIVI